MPAKVVEPNGNQMTNLPTNCGYLERADVPLDAQGNLVRIPFINNFNLKYGDLVVFNTIKNCVVIVNGQPGLIAMAEVKYDPNDDKNWKKQEFLTKWKDWSKITDIPIIYKLKLKSGVTPDKIGKLKNKKEYEAVKQK